jgi:hypothetical protein
MHTLLVGAVSNGPFDDEAEELQDFLASAAFLTPEDLGYIGDQLDGMNSTRRDRARFRYLAALFPDRSLHDLANTLHYVINNSHVSISEVRDVLRGKGNEVPIEKIQAAGKELATGTSIRTAAKKVGLNFDTVQRIERFLGIAEARRLRLVDAACDALRYGWSVRKFASYSGVPKSTAHILLRKARNVLQEIGEEVPQ